MMNRDIVEISLFHLFLFFLYFGFFVFFLFFFVFFLFFTHVCLVGEVLSARFLLNFERCN